jgi:DNA (cytosine-5)-methyltransferase 1
MLMKSVSDAGSIRPTLVSLFTGAGGLDVGLERAGFQTASAVDWDENCVETLRLNQAAGISEEYGHPFLAGAKILHADVEKLTASDLRPSGASRSWSPDVLAGGPPCQPFSSAGRMLSIHDPRGRLFEHFVRLADELRPRLILFENVRGLVTAVGETGKPGEVVLQVRRAFEDIGYATTFALLNSADYGAPQRRVRLFMMATQSTALPRFPLASHVDGGRLSIFESVPTWMSLGEALAVLPEPSDDEIDVPSSALASALASVPAGAGLKSAGAREATRPGGHWGYKQGTFIADLSKPARTVTAAASQDWIRDRMGRLRRLTWRECAFLQGFPSEWNFAGTKASRFRQIGNAVPAVFGRVLGCSLLTALAESRVRRKPQSSEFPSEFLKAIEYTRREHRRNGPSREAAKTALATGRASVRAVKGLGSAEQFVD